MKKNKETKIKENKKEKKQKEQKQNKFIEIIKKRWIANTSRTIALVAIILAFFIGVSVLIKNLELTPIDLTDDKLFTLTEESKEQVKDINKEITIYFVGYEENHSAIDLAKQYKKVNEKINVETVSATDRPDLVQKYGIDTNSQGIIVEAGKQYKVLSTNDLYTYDYVTYQSIDVTEEKLTAAIKSVSAEQLPKVYFLNGYSSFSLTNGMQYLNMYMENEVNEVETLDVLSTGKIPEDCNTLVILTPEVDFDEIATNAILEYINKGGNILWLNSAKVQEAHYENVDKILATYGVNPFEIGIIRETNNSKMISGSPDFIMPEIQYADATNKLVNSQGVIFINATKINVVDDDTLNALNVEKIDLISTSEDAYFRTNFEILSNEAQSEETKGALLVGAQFNKTISNENEENNVKSTLIIYGENYFASDYPLTQTSSTPMLAYRDNKDLVLNSIAYLTNREEDITVRKSTGAVTYTATQKENNIILATITAVPLLIIIVGIIVWIARKRKK